MEKKVLEIKVLEKKVLLKDEIDKGYNVTFCHNSKAHTKKRVYVNSISQEMDNNIKNLAKIIFDFIF